MLLVGSALKGYAIEASDGRIGSVSDLLFDDTTWKVRWIVVDTGTWLTGRKVLVHPSAVRSADHDREEIGVALTKQQVEDSPDILTDRPVSQEVQESLYGYYGWNPLWTGSYMGSAAMATPISSPPIYQRPMMHDTANGDMALEEGDPHLRSMAEVVGYHIHATDGEIGHAENLLMDDTTWDIRYLIVDTSNWWSGQHVLISPFAVLDIDFADRLVNLNVGRDRVKGSPVWDPSAMIDQYYEKRLHSHYGWPGYGW
jgi:sporulation protein YlmC with PRC-barrel domain